MKSDYLRVKRISFFLKQPVLGKSVPNVCRELGIYDATFYSWHKKYCGIALSELKHIQQLEEANLRL